MNADDEKLLQQLGSLARASERTPQQAQLDKLSSGELPEHDRNALEVAAATDAALQRALAAYEPLPNLTTAQIAERVLAATRARVDEAADGRDGVDGDRGDVEDEPGAAGAKVVALHGARGQRRQASRAVWVGLPLCAAAAAALLWLGTNRDVIAPLPVYQLEVSGGQAEVRSAPSTVTVGNDDVAPVRVGHGTTLRLVLRPQTAASSDVSARVYLAHAARAQTEWPAQIERAESGALQLVLAAPPAEIDGSSTALIVVGNSALIATRGAELAAGPAARGEDFQRWRIPLAAASTH